MEGAVCGAITEGLGLGDIIINGQDPLGGDQMVVNGKHLVDIRLPLLLRAAVDLARKSKMELQTLLKEMQLHSDALTTTFSSCLAMYVFFFSRLHAHHSRLLFNRISYSVCEMTAGLSVTLTHLDKTSI